MPKTTTVIDRHLGRVGGYIEVACLLTLALVLGACSHSIPMSTRYPLAIQNPPVKIPGVYGIYYSPEFRDHEEKLWKKGDRWDFPLGPSSVSAFDQAIPLVFEKTLPVKGRIPLDDGSTIQAVIEPRLEGFDFQLPWLKTGTYSSEISYRIILYDKKGVAAVSWVVGGVGEVNGQFGFEFARWPGESADRAVHDAVRKFAEGFANLPDVQLWLRKSVHGQEISSGKSE
jgi:hypothetical protein